MDSKPAQKPESREGGFVMVAVMALVTVLLATGLAFMHWSVDEAHQSAETTAAMQAYYLGQMGVVEKGFTYLRSLQASQLPGAVVGLPGRTVDHLGRYEDVDLVPLPSEIEGDFFAQDRRYRISCNGIVKIPYFTEGHEEYREVKRKAVLYVEVRNFADYMYLSDNEMTSFGDRIKFWNGDTLQGRVHSNSQIAIMEAPVFYEQVSTTEEDFWRGSSYNPQFLGPPPMFDVAPVLIPQEAENLRACAAGQGRFITPGPDRSARAVFDGASIRFYTWPTGTTFDSVTAHLETIPISGKTCIFVDAPLDVKGIVSGQVTIGSSQTMRLIDNIRYIDANQFTGQTDSRSPNILGLVSEAEIKVANTRENGREHSAGHGDGWTDHNVSHIVITAAVVALGESFTFENQNDPDSGYVCTCAPDDRGTIFLYGSLTQMRRGYVHRSTRGSTGYLKQYRYDRRLLVTRPPGFFDATDESGRALFNIVQWGQGIEDAEEVGHMNVNRYN